MLLPALAALALLQRRIGTVDMKGSVRMVWAFVEGLCWGAALLIKPFVALPAVAAWTVAASFRTDRRKLWLSAPAMVAGGIAVGIAGLAWLWQTGNWPYFLATMTGSWNREYFATAPDWRSRFAQAISVFWPWSLVHALAIPAALFAIWRTRRAQGPAARSQALLSAFYLGWLVQANLLQRQLAYQLLPPVILAIGLLAGLPWPALIRLTASRAHLARPDLLGRHAQRGLRWAVALGLVAWLIACHPLFRWQRLELWGRCWREGSTPEIRQLLTLEPGNIYATDWPDLERVKEFLRSQSVNDHQLTCFALTSIPLYMELDLPPSTPFVFLRSAIFFFPGHLRDISNALAASPQRFIVNDLRQAGLTAEQAAYEEPGHPLALPPPLSQEPPAAFQRYFPWWEPLAFRAGRYVVHRVTHPGQGLVPPAAPSP
jgi:hypothetical protein